jgi:hypothetical protein
MDGELAALTKLELEHLYHGRGLVSYVDNTSSQKATGVQSEV